MAELKKGKQLQKLDEQRGKLEKAEKFEMLKIQESKGAPAKGGAKAAKGKKGAKTKEVEMTMSDIEDDSGPAKKKKANTKAAKGKK